MEGGGYANDDFPHGSGKPINNEKNEFVKPGNQNDREHEILKKRLINNLY